MLTIRSALRIALAVVLFGGSVCAEESYPIRTGHIIIAFGPGTGGDFLARLVADKFSSQMNATFVVDNRPGAGGAIGTKLAADAAPDGYTLLLGSNATLIVNPTVNKIIAYDGEKDFAPIGTVARTSMVLVTAESETAPKSVAELLSMAKAKTVTFASTGVGAFGHLTSEILLRQSGMQATHVPYKSSSQSLTDVIRGEVLFANDSIAAALPLIKGGKLRALAVTGRERLKSLPNVPTFEEAGIKGMDITVWYSVMAPAGTPKAIIDRLDKELTKMVANPEVRARLSAVEFQPFALDAAKFKPFFTEELAFWRRFVAESTR